MRCPKSPSKEHTRVMYLLLSFILLANLLHCVVAANTGTKCQKPPYASGVKCPVCNTGQVTVDLAYGTETFQHPLFHDIKATNPTDTNTYTYDPCIPLTDTGCEGNQLCQNIAKVGKEALGKNTEATFQGDPLQGNLKIIYTTNTRVSTISLLCGEFGFVAQGETAPNSQKYDFTFTSPLVCVSVPGLSPGSTLLIIVLVLVLIYIIGGMLYLRFAHGARGKEMIPNYDFWEDFPLLVRDGVVFVSKGCKPDPTYQQI